MIIYSDKYWVVGARVNEGIIWISDEADGRWTIAGRERKAHRFDSEAEAEGALRRMKSSDHDYAGAPWIILGVGAKSLSPIER